jgi:hypothetical protein
VATSSCQLFLPTLAANSSGRFAPTLRRLILCTRPAADEAA